MYRSLSKELQEQIKKDTAGKFPSDERAIRRNPNHDKANIRRPAFIRDVEKIIHSPYYNRYTDKTQVFSLHKNDDISRRGLHVQFVSRIARNIGRLLNLDLDLIEAIALGHDMGHTPFGHAGEKYLNRLYHKNTGRYFSHNVHSVRVLDGIFNFNLTLQTLDGILCHNGEFELKEYRPSVLTSFEEFDKKVEQCYADKNGSERLIPSTLEGCVVRICDMIAYIGKDRQDALKAHVIESDDIFTDGKMGRFNAAIINNLIVNIVENSYGKDYIMLDSEYYNELKRSKRENYALIYDSPMVTSRNDQIIEPLFEKMYYRLLEDVTDKNENSEIYRHHIDFVRRQNRFYEGKDYLSTEHNQIVVDYMAGMTDDYFVELYHRLFPGDKELQYISYFEDLEN